MRRNLDNFAYIHHISDAIGKITEYMQSHTQAQYIDSEWDQAALMRHLEIIGEATSRLELEFRAKHSEVEWRKIIDLRNIIIHDYMEADIEVIWSILTNDIPPLKEKITTILLSSSTQ